MVLDAYGHTGIRKYSSTTSIPHWEMVSRQLEGLQTLDNHAEVHSFITVWLHGNLGAVAVAYLLRSCILALQHFTSRYATRCVCQMELRDTLCYGWYEGRAAE